MAYVKNGNTFRQDWGNLTGIAVEKMINSGFPRPRLAVKRAAGISTGADLQPTCSVADYYGILVGHIQL